MGVLDPWNSILALWIPVVVFAHLFAAAWLLKTFTLGRGGILDLIRKPKAGAGAKGQRRSLENRTKDAAKLAAKKAEDAAGRRARGADTDTDAVHDQEVGSPFEDARSLSADLANNDDDDLTTAGSGQHDLVPDVSPMAVASLRQHMSVAVDPLVMEWQDMGCAIKEHGTVKPLLQGIWGRANPGEMQALMGPSGAGKSTFIDIIAMRKSTGILSGRLLVKGRPADRSFIRKTAYVPQDDNFVPTMSVKETLDFYAKVTLDNKKYSAQQREDRVMEVLTAVGLQERLKTLVGGCLPGGLMLRGVSGGERKRLSIAAGILAAPAVLFLDEPTSGLDSFAALSVMGHLQFMARANEHIIISTIHQPRVAIWQMFDTVTLLAGGRLMYHGDREELTQWFGSLGYTHDPGRDGVASDWCLDLVAVGFDKPQKFYGHTMRTKDDQAAASQAFLDHYMRECRPTLAGNDNGVPRSASVEKALALTTQGSVTAISSKASHYASSPLTQFLSLLQREFILITRNPFDVAARCLTFTWVGILIGLLYYSLPTDGGSLRSRLNLCYVSLCFVVLMPYISMGLYTSDKKFYLADASAKLYRPLAYYLAKVVVTTPFQIICSLCFAWTVYGMAGLRRGSEHIGKFGCIITLVYLIAVQVLHCAATLAPNQDTAFMLSLVWTTIQLLVSTFFVVFSEVTFNNWLTQLRYISAVYFGFEALVLNEFDGVALDCSGGLSSDYTSFILTAFPNLSGYQKTVLQQVVKPQPGCIVDTGAVISYFAFGRPFWMSAIILTGYLLFMHAATFGVMLLSARHEAR